MAGQNCSPVFCASFLRDMWPVTAPPSPQLGRRLKAFFLAYHRYTEWIFWDGPRGVQPRHRSNLPRIGSCQFGPSDYDRDVSSKDGLASAFFTGWLGNVITGPVLDAVSQQQINHSASLRTTAESYIFQRTSSEVGLRWRRVRIRLFFAPPDAIAHVPTLRQPRGPAFCGCPL